MTDPHQLIADYEQRTAALLERAEEAKGKIKDLVGTATSQDGAVTVTVGAAGALVDLTFGSKADEMPKERLAALVMATAKRAQAQAVGQISAIMEPVVGADSDAMRFVKEQIPTVEVPDEPPPAQVRQFTLNEEQQEAAQSRPEPPPPRRSSRPVDDDDYDPRDLFKFKDGDR